MLISVRDLSEVWKVRPKSVLHVGAHLAEEEKEYRAFGWGHITWIEAQPKLVKVLENSLSPETNSVVQGAVWHTPGEKLVLNIASNSQSTSLLKFGTLPEYYPDITYVEELEVVTATLDELLPFDYTPDLINLDIQGVELDALKGFESRLSKVNWIYCEVNTQELYEGCTLLPDLDIYLEQKGFKRLYIAWAPIGQWGDAIYARQSLSSNLALAVMNFRQFIRSRVTGPAEHSIFRLNRKLKTLKFP
jgi:FkbM family methyltransferase